MPDIMTYVRDELQPSLQKRSADEHEVSRILDSIAVKAQGVFLWVRLVVKTLINGLRVDDSLDQLRTRVDSMPSDIEALYARMLANIEEAHRKEAAFLFSMALRGLTQSLLDVTFALCDEVYGGPVTSIQSALSFCRRTEKRIPIVCAGLLEVQLEDRSSEKGGGRFELHDHFVTLPCRYSCSSENADISYYERYAHVHFIHRTAFDFLKQCERGQNFQEETKNLHSPPYPTYVKALLAKVDLLGFPEKPDSTDAEFEKEAGQTAGFPVDREAQDFGDKVACATVFRIMQYLSVQSWMTATAQVPLCENVDRTLAAVYQRRRVMSRLSHWCTQWRMVHRGGNEPDLFNRCPLAIPRTGSALSFRSTTSESIPFSSGPVDFLGLAASWGLSHYVLEKLDSRPIPAENRYTDYLLCCSVRILYQADFQGLYTKWLIPMLDLTAELLSRGGSPNAYVEDFSTTIWGLFLKFRGPQGQEYPSRVLETAAKALARVAEAFLNSDADVRLKVSYPVFMCEVQHTLPSLQSVERLNMHVHFEETPLCVVQWLLEVSSEWKTAKDIILAKGGVASYQCTHVTFETFDHQPYKISRRRQAKLLEALNAVGHDDAQSWRPSTDLYDLRKKICMEHLAFASFAECDS